MLTMNNREGITPIHDPLNFSNALPIFNHLIKTPRTIAAIVCAVRSAQSKSIDDYSSEEDDGYYPPEGYTVQYPRNTPLHLEENFQNALPLLTTLETANPYILCGILSCQNMSGETPLHHPRIFQQALPLIKILAINNLSTLFLCIRNKEGQSVLHQSENFKTLLPFLIELAETNFRNAKTLMMLRNQDNLPALHHHENFKAAWPFLEQLAEKDFEKFLELMTDEDGCSVLRDANNLIVAMPFLIQLARSHQTHHLKLLLTTDLTLLHHYKNFRTALPLLEELLTIDVDLLIFLLSCQNKNQETPLHNPVIFSDASRNEAKDKIGVKLRFLFREIFRKNPSHLKTLWTVRDSANKTPLHEPLNFEKAVPILHACTQTSPDAVIEMLSCQDVKGHCPLHTPANFYFASSLLNELALSRPEKTQALLNLPTTAGITFHDRDAEQKPKRLTPANHILNFEESEPILKRIDELIKNKQKTHPVQLI